ncbi:MAG: DUF1269 domain-containing protein [Verrucomicrobiales bacterium]|nr:DUF1269 domain-containing protein [Verrucomicrobiales bacterium]MCP5525879.1 DUF1269 domain-containing protein [Verrucomicrobiales bacterium]
MATLTVWKFETPAGATNALQTLADLQRQHLITLIDAAVVTWPVGSAKPKTRQANDLVGRGALDGAFWGMLFGFLFFVPLVGMAVGAAMGALSGRFADYGIRDDFIQEVKAKVTEGSSALFLLTAAVTRDKVQEAFAGVRMELITSNLTAEEEAELRADFGERADDEPRTS